MILPWEVAAHYLFNVIWLGFVAFGLATNRWRAWIYLSLIFMAVMNVRFYSPGLHYAFSHTTAISDVLLNFFYEDVSGLSGVTTCSDNECSMLDDNHSHHTSWAVAFYNRFVHGSLATQLMLYAHIAGNSIALLLVTYQLANPALDSRNNHLEGTAIPQTRNQRHRLVGKLAFFSMCIGVLFGALLAGQHGGIEAYAGWWSTFGLWEMSACVFVTGVAGVNAVRRGDLIKHRIWMWRHAGSLWGSYFAFRLIILVADPVFIEHSGVAWNLAAWLGAPVGILLADRVRARIDREQTEKPLNYQAGSV